MPIHSQPFSDTVSQKLRNINHGLLDGLEGWDKLELAYRGIDHRDSMIVEWEGRYVELLNESTDKELKILKLEKKIDTFWDDLKEYGTGFAIGGILTALLIIFF